MHWLTRVLAIVFTAYSAVHTNTFSFESAYFLIRLRQTLTRWSFSSNPYTFGKVHHHFHFDRDSAVSNTNNNWIRFHLIHFQERFQKYTNSMKTISVLVWTKAKTYQRYADSNEDWLVQCIVVIGPFALFSLPNNLFGVDK